MVCIDGQGVRADTLAAAWTKVRANKGAAGVDGQSIERFAARADDYLAELSTALWEGSYQPQAVKRVDIPKGNGKTRPLGIPTVKDRIVQQAVRLAIEPIFETGFRYGSYGFRPGRGCHDALREVDRLIKDGYAYVADADLVGYFDSIPHDRLMARVEAKVSDGRVLDLIRGWLKADILKGLERWTPTRGGGFRREVQPRRQHWFLNEKSGFPFRTPAFCSISRGQSRLGEKEYRAPSVTPGVALRPRTQGAHETHPYARSGRRDF